MANVVTFLNSSDNLLRSGNVNTPANPLSITKEQKMIEEDR
jgi:hypothetical protein